MGPSPVNFTQPASQQLRDQWRDFRFVMKTFLGAAREKGLRPALSLGVK